MVHDSNRARGEKAELGSLKLLCCWACIPTWLLRIIWVWLFSPTQMQATQLPKSHVHCKSPRKRNPKIVVLMDWFHQPLLLLVGMVLLCCIQVASVLQEVPAEYVPFPWLPHWYSMCSSFKSSEDTHTQTCADLRLMEMCMLFPKIPGGPLVCSHFFGLSRLSP